MSTIGSRLKESRERKGLLQSELAKMIGVKSAGVISNWEQDVSKPDANKMVKLCQVLGISLSYLLDYYGEEKAPPYSSEALQLAEDYDGLDGHGKRVVRLVADEEKARCEADQQTKAAALRESREQMEAAEEVPAPSEMPTPFYEGGLEDSADELMKYVRRLNPGQQRMILEQAEKMIAARKELAISSVPPKGGNTPPESDSPTQS